MIKDLENIKLIRELNYLKSEFDYKNNLVNIYNIDFRKWVDRILNINMELRDIFEINNSLIDKEIHQDELPDEHVYKSSDKLKNFYRQIVKLTHPDRIQGDTFNVIYNEANQAFKSGNSIDIFLLCDRLGLDYEISEDEKESIKTEISDLRNRITMLESTFPYQWAIKDDEDAKNKIALNYIKNIIL